MQNHPNNPVLVTGADGYLASFLIKLLLEKDLRVRGTVLSLADKSSYQFLYDLVPEKNNNLELIEANLTEKDVWATATKGVQYVFHVASPTPTESAPKDEEYFMKPAVEGTLNVLEAALANGVKKVVVTSSGAAVGFTKKSKVLTEDDWESEEGLKSAYPKSKVRAERAVWEFYENNKDKIEVSVVNPGFVFGPMLSKKENTTTFLGLIMNGVLPGVFETAIPTVDVRDVAEVHYRAMFREGTNGKRYICVAECVSLEDITGCLNREFGKNGVKISEKKVSLEEVIKSGNPAAQVIGFVFMNTLKMDNQRSVKELGIEYLPVEKTIIDSGNDLIKFGFVKVNGNN